MLRAGADPSILSSYDAERRPQVASTIRAVTAALHLQKARWIPATVSRDLAALFLNVFPPVARYVREMRYIPKPFLQQGLVAPQSREDEASFVGRLLPMPRVRDGHIELPLDDFLGPGFAIIGVEPDTLPAGPHDPLWYALDARFAAVRRKSVSVENKLGVPALKIADDRFDDVFTAHRGQWLIVRPDRIVAAAVDAGSFHDITRFFERLFGVSRSVPQAAE